MVQHIHDIFWVNGVFQWWQILGFSGTAIFSSRFFLQWYLTEKKKRVVIPLSFWWLSLLGSLLMLAYAIITPKREAVVIISYAFTWIPYVRNIIIHNRNADNSPTCANCGASSPPDANYCHKCGAALKQLAGKK